MLLAANASSQQATVYHGFTRLDPVATTATEKAFVVVQGDRIASVGSGARRGTMAARTSTCRAATVYPAFFDTHAHVTIGPLKVEIENGAPVFRFEG